MTAAFFQKIVVVLRHHVKNRLKIMKNVYTYETVFFDNYKVPFMKVAPTFTINGYEPPYIITKSKHDNVYDIRYCGAVINNFANFDDAMQNLRTLCETYEPLNDKNKCTLLIDFD